MEDLTILKQPAYYKPPRAHNHTISPDNRNDLLNRTDGSYNKKPIALALEGNTIGLRTPQNHLKGSMAFTKDSPSSPSLFLQGNKSVTSQLMKTFANRTQNQDPISIKRVNERGSHFERALKVLPHLPLEERTKTLSSLETPYNGAENDVLNDHNFNEDGRPSDGTLSKRVSDPVKLGGSKTPKLPSIKPAIKGSDDKNPRRRVTTDKRAPAVFGYKVEPEGNSANVNRKLFEPHSASPMKNMSKNRNFQIKIDQPAKVHDLSLHHHTHEDFESAVGKLQGEEKAKIAADLRSSINGLKDGKENSNLIARGVQKSGYQLFGQHTQESADEDDLGHKGEISLTVNAVKMNSMPEKPTKKKPVFKRKATHDDILDVRRSLEVGKVTESKLADNAKMYLSAVNSTKNKPVKHKKDGARVLKKKARNSLQEILKTDESHENEHIGSEGLQAWDQGEHDNSLNKDDEEEEDGEENNTKEDLQGHSEEANEKRREVSIEPAGNHERDRNKNKTIIRGGKKATVKETGSGHLVKITKKPMGEKDEMNMRREQAYKAFMEKMNFSFNIVVKAPTEKTAAFTSYKYFLGKGNNSIMIKAMMKSRWWWVQSEHKEAGDLNFMWTQLKNNQFIESLKQRRKTPFEGLENSGISSTHHNDTTANSNSAIDSVTDCESDTTESDSRSTSVISKVKKGSKSVRTPSKKSSKKLGKFEKECSENEHLSAMNKLFTNHEIMLLGTLNGKKNVYPEDYEELGKLRKGPATQVVESANLLKMCNHLENNFHLANKKALLWNMKSYYEAIKKNVFDHLPLTFHVRNGLEDKEYQHFVEYYQNRENEIKEQERVIEETMKETGKKSTVKKLKNLWIIKPGENTNRGIGIHVCNELSQIRDLIATTEGEEEQDGRKRTYLIQQYLDRPLLYNKRKFDIRCYVLVTCINGTMKGYWYQEGYIRTASKEFSLKNVTNRLIHLTNDAVQKKAEDYGKFEAGNKLSYNDFQKYLDSTTDGKVNFNNDIYPQIRNLAIDCIKGVYGKMDPHRRENCFEVFGLDFMIDASLKAWLIEVNTNPDINASSPALTRVIPNMVENALRLTIDQMYPPPAWHLSKKNSLPENLLENNKFELVFDEVEDGPALRSILNPEKGATGDMLLEIVAEEEEEIEDEGND